MKNPLDFWASVTYVIPSQIRTLASVLYQADKYPSSESDAFIRIHIIGHFMKSPVIDHFAGCPQRERVILDASTGGSRYPF